MNAFLAGLVAAQRPDAPLLRPRSLSRFEPVAFEGDESPFAVEVSAADTETPRSAPPPVAVDERRREPPTADHAVGLPPPMAAARPARSPADPEPDNVIGGPELLRPRLPDPPTSAVAPPLEPPRQPAPRPRPTDTPFEQPHVAAPPAGPQPAPAASPALAPPFDRRPALVAPLPARPVRAAEPRAAVPRRLVPRDRAQPVVAEAERVVRVTIGRIEIRATAPPGAPPSRRAEAPARRGVMSLDDYLAGRRSLP